MTDHYPPVGFHFRVDFSGLADAGSEIYFQTVSGLDITVNTETIREGGENRFEHALPTGTTYGPLVLKRGMLRDSKVIEWCIESFRSLQFQPIDLTVTLLNDQHEPLMTWNFVRAWPTKWSVSEFNAEQNALVVETLEFKYNYFTVIK